MARSTMKGARIAGISTCVPSKTVQNADMTDLFTEQELRKIIGMVGISSRHISDGKQCSTDLCLEAAKKLLSELQWDKDSVDALIMITQSPDYLLPSSSCLIHRDLDLSEDCASFDVGLGCSGYPYGLWLANMMLASGQCKRILLLHGETPSLFTNPEDRATALLFGDAGSATALEADSENENNWHYNLKTDGKGFKALVIEAGGFRTRIPEDPSKYYVSMNGPQLFTFTTQKVPALIDETLAIANTESDRIDYFIFHQANRFITRHIAKKMGVDDTKIPSTIEEFGNTGGVSVPLTITKGLKKIEKDNTSIMALGYGVGLSWGSALINLNKNTILMHCELAGSEI
ncbi:ketoacyl-ACP synthase III [Aurantivibrio infirmus]